MIEKSKLGFVGTGNMGRALIEGLVGQLPVGRITAADIRPEALAGLSALGVHTSTDAADAVRGQDLVVLVLKPQVAAPVLKALAAHFSTQQVVVSLMAGVSTARLEELLPAQMPVVRVMPQTLVKVRGAACALCTGRAASAEQVAQVRSLFDLVGTTVEVAESLMDAVTGLSGSGPAWAYTVVEALTDGGVRAGLPRETALTLAAQTLLGAARLVLESGEHPAVLRDQVTSPGGTTAAGLHKLEEKGLRDALISAVLAAAERSAELGQS